MRHMKYGYYWIRKESGEYQNEYKKAKIKYDIDIAVYGGDFDSFYWDIKEKVHSLHETFLEF